MPLNLSKICTTNGPKQILDHLSYIWYDKTDLDHLCTVFCIFFIVDFNSEFLLLATDSPDFSGGVEEPLSTVHETSVKRLVVGPLDVRLHSSAVHRILKMVSCAMDHEYEPYCKPHQGLILETLMVSNMDLGHFTVLCQHELQLSLIYQ